MQPEEQRIAIAEACGWKNHATGPYPDWRDPDGCSHNTPTGLPAYLSSLDAMHEAKRQLLNTPELCYDYNRALIEEKPDRRDINHEVEKWSWGQSAEVEARSLLKTLNLWTE